MSRQDPTVDYDGWRMWTPDQDAEDVDEGEAPLCPWCDGPKPCESRLCKTCKKAQAEYYAEDRRDGERDE